MMTAHQGRSADPRLIQTINEKEMIHSLFTNQCQKLTPDSQTQRSSFVFFFSSFSLLPSLQNPTARATPPRNKLKFHATTSRISLAGQYRVDVIHGHTPPTLTTKSSVHGVAVQLNCTSFALPREQWAQCNPHLPWMSCGTASRRLQLVWEIPHRKSSPSSSNAPTAAGTSNEPETHDDCRHQTHDSEVKRTC